MNVCRPQCLAPVAPWDPSASTKSLEEPVCCPAPTPPSIWKLFWKAGLCLNLACAPQALAGPSLICSSVRMGLTLGYSPASPHWAESLPPQARARGLVPSVADTLLVRAIPCVPASEYLACLWSSLPSLWGPLRGARLSGSLWGRNLWWVLDPACHRYAFGPRSLSPAACWKVLSVLAGSWVLLSPPPPTHLAASTSTRFPHGFCHCP